MKRFDCLKILNDEISSDTVTVTSFTGNSREWGYLRGSHLNMHNWNMGLCVPVAVGVAAARPNLNVVAIDADGSFMLDIGVLATASRLHLKNLAIVVFDNEAYAGHGPTATAEGVSLERLAGAVDIKAQKVTTVADFQRAIRDALKFEEPTFMVVKVENYTVRPPDYVESDVRIIANEFTKSFKALSKKNSLAKKKKVVAQNMPE